MRQFVSLLAHKRPDMKILEIGAGTGGATAVMLETLGAGKVACFSQYDFTDISSGYFEKAEEKFQEWRSLLQFKKLNIEISPKDQGFEEGSYDLIVAANVLHATANMNMTMSNVRRLLKPNGKLLLIEIMRAALHTNVIYGTLPGWWLGKVLSTL